jgi:hypothetical protein
LGVIKLISGACVAIKSHGHHSAHPSLIKTQTRSPDWQLEIGWELPSRGARRITWNSASIGTVNRTWDFCQLDIPHFIRYLLEAQHLIIQHFDSWYGG